MILAKIKSFVGDSKKKIFFQLCQIGHIFFRRKISVQGASNLFIENLEGIIGIQQARFHNNDLTALTLKVLISAVNHSLLGHVKCTLFQGQLQSTLALSTVSLGFKIRGKNKMC